MANSDDLLNVLNAHGQRFLESFSFSSTDKPKQRLAEDRSPTSVTEDHQIEDEEWNGCEIKTADSTSSEGSDIDIQRNNLASRPSSHPANVTTCPAFPGEPSITSSRAIMRAFMSSKVSKTRASIQHRAEDGEDEDREEAERTNIENDALLHHLVHTQLLSGSLKPDLGLTPAQRRRALAGRVLELSGGAKLGKGETVVRVAERNKAAPRVRIGLVEKQKERERQRLEKAKGLGNYHPAIKTIFKPSETTSTRKRERGLKTGIGTFRGGMLYLSREEINAVENAGKDGRHVGSSGRKTKRVRR